MGFLQISKTDSNKPLYKTECEDSVHMFIKCEELQDFKQNCITNHLESFLKDCQNKICNFFRYWWNFDNGIS